MLKFSKNTKNLELVEESRLAVNDILERQGLQQAIVNSWDHFRKEIEMPSLFLIGQEIIPHPSVQDRIDILAFDPDDSLIVVIELKRDKNKLQLLQGISYAAMMASWTPEKLLEMAKQNKAPEYEDLADCLSQSEFKNQPRIILMAERFDPEVIITADWLYQKFDLDILAFGIKSFSKGADLYISLNQRYPLEELHETYDSRRSNRVKTPSGLHSAPETTWDEVAKSVKYPWGKQIIDLCLKITAGEPDRRRFGGVRKRFDGFDWITVNVRRNYANIYMRGNPENAETYLQSKFSEPITIGKWRDGFSFDVNSEKQFKDLVKWLDLSGDARNRSSAA